MRQTYATWTMVAGLAVLTALSPASAEQRGGDWRPLAGEGASGPTGP